LPWNRSKLMILQIQWKVAKQLAKESRQEEVRWSQRRELNPHLISKTRRLLYLLSYVGSVHQGFAWSHLCHLSAGMELMRRIW
jgi:hypothetical protein